ncbi:MAG TPA: hypothetical protein VFY06_04595 [Verrucomicrobiae bacterium]|nr:hypothetical protein [Verrucomicrobiae bacterium]
MIHTATWERFSQLLDIRLAKSVFTTEDSVRYTFFAAVLECENLNPEDIILEHRHPKIRSALIDTWISAINGNSVALEFKYHRDIPSGSNANRTELAGKIFHDLYRLGQFDTTALRIFVYLASNEMTNHFSSERNRLNEFFSLGQGAALRIDDAFFAGRAKSFTSMVPTTPNIEVVSLFTRSLPQNHQIRAYEVREIERQQCAPADGSATASRPLRDQK